MGQVELEIMSDGTVLCPRCRRNYYTPNGVADVDWEKAPRPALSRMTRDPELSEEELVYVCSPCGQDEAMRDAFGTPVPISEWPIGLPGFGLGREETRPVE